MKLRKVVIKNFLSIREATVNLLDRGLVSIEGETTATDGTTSNGSGKSSLINAVLWCNYDDAGKKLDSVDDVVHSKASGDCMVKCYWYDEHNDVDYIVSRYRKHSIFKNSVTVERTSPSGTVDLTKGTNPETQLVINRVLGADQATFEAYCFARQEKAPDIPGMTDGELKSLLEKVLPLEELSKLYGPAQKNLDNHLAAIKVHGDAIDKIDAQVEHTTELYNDTKEAFDRWASEASVRKAKLEDQIVDLKVKIKLIDDSLAAKPLEKIDARIAEFTDLLSRFDDLKLASDKEKYSISLYKVDKALAYASALPKECPTCNREFENYSEQKAKADLALEEAREEHSKNAKTMLDWNVLIKERDKWEQSIQKLNELSRQVERERDQKKALEADLKRLTDEMTSAPENPHGPTLGGLKRRLAVYRSERDLAVAAMEELDKKTPILEAVAETYSPKGLRYHILDSITPELNARTNHYLSQLSDGTMQATWSTVTKLKSGSFKEKFSIKVTAREAKGYGSLSGGEKRKVRLACFFALQDLIAKKATKTISLWCADEIDHALDPAGLERLMGLLHEKVAAKSTILVISHNELREWIPNFTTVVKEDGVSTITGYLNE